MTLNLRMVLQADSAAAKAALDDAARGVKGVTTATDAQTRASRAAAGAADAEAAAKRRNAQASREMATANRQAAGATGNLVGQFNDIWIMMAAGQNPLQLAIQQGTQITQVIGNQGAAGAAKQLKDAFFLMINPVNAITIGFLAAGAAAVQWLTGAEESVRSLEDQIESLKTSVSSWRENSGKWGTDLRKEFGSITPEVVALHRELLAIDIRRIEIEAINASRAMREELGNVDVQELLGLKRVNAKQLFPEIDELRAQMDAAMTAASPLDQANGWAQVAATLRDAAGGVDNMNDAQLAFYYNVLNTEAALRAAAVATGDVTQEIVFADNDANGLKGTIDLMAGPLANMAGISLSGIFTEAEGPARALLRTVLEIGGEMYRMAAFQKAQMNLAADGKVYSGRGGDPRKSNTQGYGEFIYTGPNLDAFNNPIDPKRRGGGGSETEKQEKALAKLVDSLNAEIAALREQDPIQQEMLKHRDALKNATEAERQKVEELIATRERERAAMETITQVQDFLESTVDDAFEALIVKGESLQDVLKGVIAALAKAAIQAAIFGSGPLGGIFGGKGIGATIFGGFATGGMVHGPGSPTSDSIPTMLSNGEFVVNAKATARNRHLLEAINSGGTLRGFAGGGYAGSDRRSASPGMSGGSPTFNINLAGARGDREVEEAARRGMKRALQEYDRESLPTSVKRISADQRRVG